MLVSAAFAAPGARAATPAVQSFDASPVADPISPVPPLERSPCGQGSWLAGSVEVCAGEIVYRDYVYDDFGAALTPGPPPDFPFPAGFDPTSFPTFDAYGGLPPSGVQSMGLPDAEQNIADLVALRLRRDGAAVLVSAELNSLFDPATTQVVLAIDADPGAATGGGPWPGLVANPNGSVPLTSSGWDTIVELGGGDAATNTYTGSFALPAGPTFRIQAVAARADGTVMNVAFRGVHETGFWWDALQATTLAAGDIAAFGLDVALDDLDPTVTRRATTPAGEVLQRVYVSEHPVGEGVSRAGVDGPATGTDAGNPVIESVTQGFTLLGRYQPYGFVLPSGPGPHGAQLMMHGLAENHSARVFFPGTDTSIVPVVAEARDRMLVSPTARGWRGWYSGHSERDAWDAFADAVANHDDDPARWFISGYSMGGYGTLRLGSLYPDLWAGSINWVGYSGDFFNGAPFEGFGGDVGSFGNARDLLGNMRHVPMGAVYAAADELVPLPQGLDVRQTLADEGVPSLHWVIVGEHVTPMLADDWSKESAYSADRTRVRQPALVTYRTEARFTDDALGLHPDHAYWVWHLRPAGDGPATVRATSGGCGGGIPVTEASLLAPDPSPPLVDALPPQEVQVVRSDPAPAGLHVTTTNVAAAVVDSRDGAHGACLGPGEVPYRIETDGPLSVRLHDGRVLTAPQAGVYEGVLAAVATLAAGPDAAPSGSLPATGAASHLAPVLAAAALALAGRAAHRRFS